MPRQVDQAAAVAVMLAAGLRPLEPRPASGANRGWRCHCERCGNEVAPHFSTVRAGVASRGPEYSGCRFCAAVERGRRQKEGMARKAETLMRKYGWVPLTPYPGALERWPCRCGVCGGDVEVTFAKVQDRGQDRCGPCSQTAKSMRLLAEQAGRAAVDLVAAGWEPLADYPGVHRGWKALHGVCGQIRYPLLSEIRAGEVCCSGCNGSVRLGDEEAAEFMRSAGFKPLEPYPGSQVPWRSQCLR
ncbi:hypothetical protein [Kitasatospora sp. NPDC056531]|uniref:hypothetical protein n=1 Tax=Kitasatospora sp. NPDC056531 TaxID=3345856 RepID=UPI0036B2EDAF